MGMALMTRDFHRAIIFFPPRRMLRDTPITVVFASELAHIRSSMMHAMWDHHSPKLVKILPRRGLEEIDVCVRSWLAPDLRRRMYSIRVSPIRSVEVFMDLMNDNTDNIMHPEGFEMITLLGNCRGLGNEYAVNTARDLLEVHQPDCIILTETRMAPDQGQNVVGQFPLDGWFATNTIGQRGGILMLWNTRRIRTRILAATEHEVHVIMEVPNTNCTMLLSVIYVSPRYRQRKLLWENLESILLP